VRPPVDVSPDLERISLVLEIEDGHRPSRRLAFSRHTLSLGHNLPTLNVGGNAEVAVASSTLAAPRRFTLVESEGTLGVSFKGDRDATWSANGRSFTGTTSTTLDVGSVVASGDVRITIVAFTPIVPASFEETEGAFLAPIKASSSDVAARLVYADLLEQNGELIRAEYLRVQVRLLLDEAVDGDAGAHERLKAKLSPARKWRGAVGVPTLATQCPQRAGRNCPTQWGGPAKPTMCGQCGCAVPFERREP
jgi:uncharacterized protein (TIGR02996 family)